MGHLVVCSFAFKGWNSPLKMAFSSAFRRRLKSRLTKNDLVEYRFCDSLWIVGIDIDPNFDRKYPIDGNFLKFWIFTPILRTTTQKRPVELAYSSLAWQTFLNWHKKFKIIISIPYNWIFLTSSWSLTWWNLFLSF